MDTIADKTPPRWMVESLERSEAQADAGDTVPIEPVLDRLRVRISQMQSGRVKPERARRA
jgi:hypothetical protein